MCVDVCDRGYSQLHACYAFESRGTEVPVHAYCFSSACACLHAVCVCSCVHVCAQVFLCFFDGCFLVHVDIYSTLCACFAAAPLSDSFCCSCSVMSRFNIYPDEDLALVRNGPYQLINRPLAGCLTCVVCRIYELRTIFCFVPLGQQVQRHYSSSSFCIVDT